MRSGTNFQQIMDQWDLFYLETFPLIQQFCEEHAINPGVSIKLLEKAFFKLSFEYPNLVEQEYVALVERLFDIILEIQDSVTEEENLHNNALVLMSQYYQAN